MKRSEINQIIRSGNEFIKSRGFYLPPFAYWSLDEWKARKNEAQEIIDTGLGWDITDFGSGKFKNEGLFIFTIRNGSQENLKTMKGKLYAEKIMMVEVNQITPMHFHWNKMEDIINRGGGNLAIKLYNSTHEEELDTRNNVRISVDGITRTVKPGGIIELTPGESITLVPGCYHEFWGHKERVLVGEVSLINDDNTDNRFYKKVGRFPEIGEDEEPLYLLCSDYQKYLGGTRG